MVWALLRLSHLRIHFALIFICAKRALGFQAIHCVFSPGLHLCPRICGL